MPGNEGAWAVAKEWMAKADNDLKYATVTRYPGDYEPISMAEAREAVKIARRVRWEVRKILEEKPLF
jgi:HEPN domain-containing protein